jgi:formylglycine-generating enzyme required for sulfatase activity
VDLTDMAHDVFVSHSTKDKTISDAICAALEGAGIRCWIAPRDVQPGRSFAGEINRAIQHSKVMVLIFSAHSNTSEQVLREVQLAVNSRLHIIQFRIEDVRLNDDLEYFLSTPHWLDALTPPLENHLKRLRTSIQTLLEVPAEQSATTTPSASALSEKREVAANVPQRQEVSMADKPPPPSVNRGRKSVFAAVLVALLTAGVLAGWWFGFQQPRREAERRRQLEQGLIAQPPPKQEEAKKEEPLRPVAAASKEQPYVNSLGMQFVPVPGINVLFSIWETRVRDYKVFVEETKREWAKADFEQTEEHPAVNVSWEDATAFCEWLTQSERKAARIAASQSYRLPGDEEWSVAVGLEKESGSTPKERQMKIKGVYPWGRKWPPPWGAGNYDPTVKVDDFAQTSPAGSFAANQNGIYDLGGNAWEWCADKYEPGETWRVLRGASWFIKDPDSLLSSNRGSLAPTTRYGNGGFRCVLVVESSR